MSSLIPYGRRLPLSVIEQRAQANHRQPYASIPKSKDANDGYQDVSYRQFLNAINRCAHWLRDSIGTSSSSETLLYMGTSDLRYQIIAFAAIKTGHVMFFSSPRNNLDAHLHLIAETGIRHCITPPEAPPVIASILAQRPLQHNVIPELYELLDERPVEHIHFDGTFEDYKMKPWLIIHTSGSTGMPKPIYIRHGLACSTDAWSLLDGGSEVVQRAAGLRTLNPFPPFHIAGLGWSTFVIIWVDGTYVAPPPSPLTAELVDSIHRSAGVEHSMIPPSVVVDLVKQPEYMQNVTKLRALSYAGGPLPQSVGDAITDHIPLYTSMGATEYVSVPLVHKDPKLWSYYKFNTSHGGIQFRDAGEGLYEMVFVRKPELELMQGAFITFPELDEYRTKDLFSPHPTQPDLWKYSGRADDIIVFSNGEKFNPVTMEGTISACPEVKGCLIVGQGKFQSALLVEPKIELRSEAERTELLAKIWPFVQRANEMNVKQGKVSKDLIGFTVPDKPLPRAGKGTIQRAMANTLYRDEIDQLFDNFSNGTRQQDDHVQLSLSGETSTFESLRAHIARELQLNHVSADDDFFQLGMDSIQLIELTRAINASLSKQKIEPKQVYENASLSKLTALIHSGPAMDDYFSEDEDFDTWEKMQGVFEKKAQELPGQLPERSPIEDWIFARSSHSTLVPPDGGRTAYLQILGAFLININNWGLVNAFGVFQAFYETNFLSSYSPSSIAWIGTVQGALLLIVGVISGPLFDKGYFRIVLVSGSLGLVFAVMMLSLSTKFYQIMLTQGILAGICSGLLYIPSVALIPMYFDNRRGLALGLALSGGPFGGVIYPIAFRRLLDEVGFGWATRIIGFIALATLICATIIIQPRSPSRQLSRQLLDTSALKDPAYITFMLTAFLLFCGSLVPFFLTPIYASEHLGVSPDLSFYLLAVLNTGQIFGRIVPAALSDLVFVGPEWLLLGAEVACGVLGLCWIGVYNLGGFVCWVIAYGLASGVVTTLPAIVLAYVCPSLAVLGTRLGMLYAAAGVGALIGTPIALAAGNASDNGFLGAQLWTGLIIIAAACSFIYTFLHARRRRRLIDEKKRRRYEAGVKRKSRPRV